MGFLKRIWNQLHRFVFWAIILSILWAWIYLNFVGDARPAKKLVLTVESGDLKAHSLAVLLEEPELPEGLRMVQVRSFDYDIFGSAVVGDLYIMRESTLLATLKESPEKLAPLELPEGWKGWSWQDSCYGVMVYDLDAGLSVAGEYIRYAPLTDQDPEPCYLCLDAQSVHRADGTAWTLALRFLALEERGPEN